MLLQTSHGLSYVTQALRIIKLAATDKQYRPVQQRRWRAWCYCAVLDELCRICCHCQVDHSSFLQCHRHNLHYSTLFIKKNSIATLKNNKQHAQTHTRGKKKKRSHSIIASTCQQQWTTLLQLANRQFQLHLIVNSTNIPHYKLTPQCTQYECNMCYTCIS